MDINFSISIVLPAYNEEENIKRTVEKCIHFIEQIAHTYEIIVINDGSHDKTAEIVKKICTTSPKVMLINHDTNRGYGSALRSGLDAASMKYIFYMDSDGQFEITDLNRLIPLLNQNEVVIGFRQNRADTFIRSLNAWLYSLYIRLIFGLKVRDIDCAFKIFPKMAYKDIKPIKSSGALFSAEFLIKLKHKGYQIKEVAVRHFPRKHGVQSGANIKVIFKMFKESWILRNELWK